MSDIAQRARQIDVLFNAIGMDDVRGSLLVDISADDFGQPRREGHSDAVHHGAVGGAPDEAARSRGHHVDHGGSHAPAVPRRIRGRVRGGRRALVNARGRAGTIRDPAPRRGASECDSDRQHLPDDGVLQAPAPVGGPQRRPRTAGGRCGAGTGSPTIPACWTSLIVLGNGKRVLDRGTELESRGGQPPVDATGPHAIRA